MKLPDKKSEILELAIADFEKCLINPNIDIEMERWVETRSAKHCEVCLAGAVMLGLKTNEDLATISLFNFDKVSIEPSDFVSDEDYLLRSKLVWLNNVRIADDDDFEIFIQYLLPWVISADMVTVDECNLEDKLIPYLKARVEFYKANSDLDNNMKY
jgi:hypothetical protein